MSAQPKPVPNGYTSVTPWIIGRDTAKLMEFLSQAFIAEELGRMDVGGKIGHAEMRIGDGVIMMFDAPDNWPATPAFIRLFLQDVSTTFDRSVSHGATPITKPTLLGFGDLVARIRDPFGNVWWLQQRVEDVQAEEAERRWSDPKWIEAMNYVQETLKDAHKL